MPRLNTLVGFQTLQLYFQVGMNNSVNVDFSNKW